MKYIKCLLTIIFIYSFFGCEDIFIKSGNDENNLEDFEKAWQGIDYVYPYFEVKNIDWDQIYQEYRPKAEIAKGDEIYTVLIDLISELKDQHPYIKFMGGCQATIYLSPRYIRDRDLFDPKVVKKYFDKEFNIAGKGYIEYQVLPDNIGYINISSLSPQNLVSDFGRVLDYFANAKGIIIDVRHNMGGAADNSNKVLSYLINSDFQVPQAYYLKQIVTQDPIKPNGYEYSNPIVVLINGVSYSEAERFTEMMKQLPNVTAVGDTTGGGSAGSNGIRDEIILPSGKIVHVGNFDFRRYDGRPWEWIGIEPDIQITNTQENLKKGIDNQLEYAIGLLK
jgi:C-terminal processing protease CtpA/Prc